MENVKYLATIIGAFIGGLFGGIDGFLYALIVLMVTDYVSGVLVAISFKELSSAIGAKGIAKKVQILLLVLVGNVIDTKIIGTGYIVRTAVIFCYISNECISITENTAKLGLPVPKKLMDVLKQLRNEDEEDRGGNEDENNETKHSTPE